MRPSRQILGLLLLAVLAFAAGAAYRSAPIDAPGVGDRVQPSADHPMRGEGGKPSVPAEPEPAPQTTEPEPAPEDETPEDGGAL